MKKIKFIFIIFILQTGFVQAYTFPMAEFSATSSEIRDFATTSTTTLKFLKTYKIPKEGVRIKSTEANFSVFPDYLTFSPGKKIFLISRKWQTACMYDEYGRKFFLQVGSDVKDFCVQTSTGKKDLPTELGLYNIQTKFGKDYKSAVLSVGGSGSYFVKTGKIFDIMGKTVEGYTAKIFVDKVVLSGEADNVFELKIKTSSDEEAKAL
jgi:hypothetical protein